MGCLFATALHRSDCATTLLLRDNDLNETVPVVVERHGRRSRIALPASSVDAGGPVSHLLVTTKAYDARHAMAAIAHRLQNDGQVLLMMNGMGLADELREDFPQLDFYSGTTTQGAYRLAPRHIRHAGQGHTRIGQPGIKSPPSWYHQWSRAIDSCLWDSNIEEALWLKLAINCAINPLTAVHGCRNGELASRPELASQVALLCDEIALISSAAGQPRVAADLRQAVNQVIAATADNRSSMLQDVEAGRRTEVDYITGYLLSVGRDHGIPAPHNAALLESIQHIDR
jgi:2-dehydropantoate 2-reductase